MNNNEKIAFNSIIIYIRLIVVSLISVILSRVLLEALGASDFGLYNVVGGIVLLLGVVNTSMTSTTYRYLAYEIGKKQSGNPNKIYNASVTIHLMFAILIILLGLPIGEFYISHYLNVPAESISDAHFVFRLSILSAAISTIFIPNQGLLVAYEKFTITACIDIVANILKLILIISLIHLDVNRIRLYSMIMLLFTTFNCSMYYLYCNKNYKNIIRINLCKDKSLYKEMISFSGWTLFGAAANVGKTQGSAMILNYFFGTIVNAGYAIAGQIESLVMMFARSLGSAAVPQTTKSYSAGDTQRAVMLTSRISKYTFVLMGLISFPLMKEMDFILSLWLKDVPDTASIFCKLIILGNLIGCLGEGIPNLINACGKIKAYQVVVHTILLLGIPISIICCKLGAEAYNILVVFCIINFMNSFVKLAMLHRVIKFSISDFMKVSHLKILLMSIPLFLYYWFVPIPSSMAGHIFSFVCAFVFYILILFTLGLDQIEKEKIKCFFVNKFIKHA